MANFFEQFHDAPEPAAPQGDTAGPSSNFFSQFHPEPTVEAGKDGGPSRLVMDMSKRPDHGTADAIGRGVAQGATAGFGDEIRGLVEAGGANPDDPASVYKLLHGALKYWSGDADAKTQYDETVLREREANKAAEENHPKVSALANVGGAIATLPIGGGASEAATWAARAIAAAKQGAVYGGLSGAGDGEGAADTAIKAAGGTLLGGVVGGVAAPLIEGAGKLASMATQKLRNTVRGARDPEAEASRQYLTALEHDRAADPNFHERMTPAEFHAHPDARLMDLGGGTMRRLADASGIISPGGETKLKDAIKSRFEGQTGRFSDWFRSNFHYPDAYQTGQAIDQVAKTVNGPNYAKAYQDGRQGVWSKELERLTGAPSIQEAINGAVKPLKDRGIEAGYKLPRDNPFKMTAKGNMERRLNDGGNQLQPELAFWDQAVRNLSGKIGTLQRAGNDTRARDLVLLKKQLTDELDRLQPSYKTARQGAAGFFGQENALEAGKSFVTSDKIGVSEARGILARMAPAERRLFQDGFVDEYLGKVINSTNDNRDVLLKIAQNPQARAKLELVMGPQKMGELEAKIRVEKTYDQVRKAVQGQSITAKRLYDLGMFGGGSIFANGAYETDPKKIAEGALITALSTGGKRINANVATKLVGMMLSRDPAVVQKGFKALSGNSRMMDALREADTKIGRVIGSMAPTGRALQSAGAVRADPGPPKPKPIDPSTQPM
jgi:hypothetical protein